MFHTREDFPLGRAVTRQLIDYDHPWHVYGPLQQLTEEFLCGVLLAPMLPKHIKHVAVLIHGPPQTMALAIDRQKDFVKMPFVAWSGLAAT